MVATPSLDELLVPRTRDDLEQIVLSRLQDEGFPVTDWFSGSVARTIVKAIATALADRETLIRYIASGQFLSLAAELLDPDGNPVEDWCEILASEVYNLTRGASTACQKSITLTCTSGPGPYTRAAGELKAISQAGHYYTNTAEVTIPDGSSVVVVFQADTPGLLSDATGTIDTLTTPLPGVTIIDQVTQFSVPVSRWTGTGSIAASATGWPTPVRTIKVTITATGRIGEATFTTTVYSGGTVTTSGTITTAATYAQGDVTLTFTDGSGTSNSFIGGDTWTVGTPGESTVASGSDQEPLTELATRCRGRWPSLSAIPTESRYETWARQCSIDNSLGITRYSVKPSTTIAGNVNVYLADAAGTAPVEAIATIQDYLDMRTSEIERADAAAATPVTVTVAGYVWVRRAIFDTVKAAAKIAWNTYLANIPIGGELPDRSVKVSVLNQVLMDLGAFDTDSLAINGAAKDVDLILADDEVPAGSTDGTDDLTWNQIP